MNAVLLVQLDVDASIELLAELEDGRKEKEKERKRRILETSSAHNNGHYILGSDSSHSLPVGPQTSFTSMHF